MKFHKFIIMKRLENKYLLIIFLSVAISTLLSGSIEYWLLKYSATDQIYYREMAESAPLLNFNIPHFFAYRILPAWIAGIIPGDVPFGFRLMNIIFLFLLSYSFYFLMNKLGLRENISVLLTFIFVFNRYFFQLQAWNYFQLSDLMSNTIIFCMLLALISGRYLLLGLLFFIGIMCKETVLVIIPVSIIWFYQTEKRPKEYWKILLFSIPAVALFFVLRLFIPTIGNENLLLQSVEESYKYLNPIVWIKVLVVPFLPFSLLPIIFYKEFAGFVKSKLFLVTLFAFVILTAVLGYDFERLITPAAPAFYFFVGVIYEKYFKSGDAQSKILISVTLLLAFANSFYHLWGNIKLPNSTVTIIESLFILILNSAVFIYVKRRSNSSSESLA